ncbi:hypothetical protein C2857_000338 [Epichloe festucae Fl1]|uniref:Uncharacterized protein n=1 Tax=Epichloe festucae (strain Fl1) TaxID=877507 RepID=A0A7U3Q110_EPIFF|nr:hypothetical protein C2857_000338 [Epichloe festucae Fl1]
MKVSTTFVLTLLTGALAAPRAVDVDSEERGVLAARDFQDALAEALDAGEVKTDVLLTERDAVSVEALDVIEDDDAALEARGTKKAKAQAKGKGRGKGKGKGKRRKGKGKAKAKAAGKGKGKGRGKGKGKGKGKRNGRGKKNNNAKGGKTKDAAAPRVTSSFDAPGVVDA